MPHTTLLNSALMIQLDTRLQKWIIAFTGASGMRYGVRLLETLADTVGEVHAVFSESALRVLQEEENLKISQSNLSTRELFGRDKKNVFFYNPKDIGATIASGSALFQGMVVCPCSMNTLAAIAHGMSSNLIHRAADVTMKEGRKLVIVPRETPLSAIHLENMLQLSRVGVSITAAMPGFYHNPASVNDLVDMMVMKILDQMGIPNQLVKRWGEDGEVPSRIAASALPGGIRKVVELRKDA